jgi:hypothetical protein
MTDPRFSCKVRQRNVWFFYQREKRISSAVLCEEEKEVEEQRIKEAGLETGLLDHQPAMPN